MSTSYKHSCYSNVVLILSTTYDAGPVLSVSFRQFRQLRFVSSNTEGPSLNAKLSIKAIFYRVSTYFENTQLNFLGTDPFTGMNKSYT